MRSHLLAAVVSTIATNVVAQCGMTTELQGGTVYQGPATCPGYTWSVNTTGGTAPYTIWLYKGTFLFMTFTNDADGDLVFPNAGQQWGTDIGVTVSDANNCVASDTDDGHPWLLYDFFTVYVGATDCTTGQRRIFLSTTPLVPCINSIPYSIHSLSTGTTLTGDVNTWTAQNGQLWSPFTLPAGGYSLSFGRTWDCGDVVCSTNANQGISVPAGDISPGDCGVNVAVHAALQGALPSGTVMGDSLRAHGLLPLTEPYSALGYSYAGMNPGASTTQALLNVTGNNAIVDWVIVELRNSANTAQVMFSRPALLQRDGDVMDLDGDSYVNFPNASGSYYVSLRHRNHLGVMTSSAVALSTTPVTVNFQSASTACYGTAPRAQVGSVYCLWSGDGNGNGTIGYTGANNDRDPILTAIGGSTPNNALNNVYDRRDTNLDGVIRYTGTNNDRDPILTNVGSTTPNNTRTQQLP